MNLGHRIGLMAATLTLVVASAIAYQPAALLFTFQDASIVESSGLASSSQPGVLFTHNDSGDRARFFAVGPDGSRLAAFELAGAAAIDWEDMARGPGRDGGPALFFADIGDNSHVHAFVTVYEVPEPVILESSTTPVVITDVIRHMLVYEDLSRPDAETLLVDPSAYGRFAIVTKDGDGASRVYETTDEPGEVVRVVRSTTTIDFAAWAPIIVEPGVSATGGAIAPDRSRVVVRTYWYAFEWQLGPGTTLASAFAQAPAVITLPETVQGEAITYSMDSADLLTSSEGANAPVHILRG